MTCAPSEVALASWILLGPLQGWLCSIWVLFRAVFRDRAPGPSRRQRFSFFRAVSVSSPRAPLRPPLSDFCLRLRVLFPFRVPCRYPSPPALSRVGGFRKSGLLGPYSLLFDAMLPLLPATASSPRPFLASSFSPLVFVPIPIAPFTAAMTRRASFMSRSPRTFFFCSTPLEGRLAVPIQPQSFCPQAYQTGAAVMCLL